MNIAKRRNNRLLVENIDVLRTAFYDVKKKQPFRIEAAVIMPDPLHCLWTLPPGDANYSMRWGQIKGRFSSHIYSGESIANSRKKRRERGLRQRRFWTHLITDQDDFNRHVDDIHCVPGQARLGLPSCRLAAFEFFQVCKNGRLSHDLGAFG
ncbi:MAG: REP-associated tyrosine transposase [Methylobacter sp.]